MVAAIVCADWSKERNKRAVYVADVGTRTVRRLACPDGWCAAAVLQAAQEFTGKGAVLVGFDAPLGVPRSYADAVRRELGVQASNFLELLAGAAEWPEFFKPSRLADEWRPDRPFFAVPAGTGGLTRYRDAVARHGVELYREIDRTTNAKSCFIVSGVPGSVGSSAIALWDELLRPHSQRNFAVWPFDGELGSMPITVAEIYPGATYRLACGAGVKGKTKQDVREQAVDRLLSSRWVAEAGIAVQNTEEARGSEDEFDACIAGAALLRCVLEGLPLYAPEFVHPFEGGMLGTAASKQKLVLSRF